MATQGGPSGIQVSWTPPTPLGDTTGYRIYYSGSSGSVDVSDGLTVSIVGTSEHFFSEKVEVNVILGK